MAKPEEKAKRAKKGSGRSGTPKHRILRKHGPWKPNTSATVGTYAQTNSFFLKQLWGDYGSALRKALLQEGEPKTKENETKLRKLLFDYGLEVPDDIRLMVVDIETGITRSYIDKPAEEEFYILVLPAKPLQNTTEPSYEVMQRWAAAHYHAINDTYGM